VLEVPELEVVAELWLVDDEVVDCLLPTDAK
jgi:hypothetical protein